MKIWFGFGSENSSNFVIIGTFKKAGEAQQALDLINEAQQIASAEYDAGRLDTRTPPDRQMSDAVLDFARRTDLMTISNKDLVELLYEFHPMIDDGKLVITMNEWDVNFFVKAITHLGGRVEVYSAHDYRSKFGRQTYTGE